jgi:hypothetical protein
MSLTLTLATALKKTVKNSYHVAVSYTHLRAHETEL